MPNKPRKTLVEAAFEALPQPVVLTSEDGEILFTNPTFDALFPADSELISSSGRRLPFLTADGQRADNLDFDYANRKWRARPFALDIGSLTLWVIDDMDVEGEAQEVQNENLSKIVHDLRSPLSGIRGTIDFVLDDPEIELTVLHKDLLQEAQAESERMMNLINEILGISHLRSASSDHGSQKISPAILIRRSAMAVRSLATRQKITLWLEVPRNIGSIRGNMDRLLQVMTNLVSNAFKFTPDGGSILLSARESKSSKGDRILLAVTDTGPGIPRDKQDALFSKFAQVGTQTEKGIAGTGLGLFITKEIAETYDGEVSFASIPGAGTSFLVDLPLFTKS